MSEQPTAAPSRPKPGQGKKYAGLTRNQWLITGGVFVAVLAYFVWKRRQASQASSTAATNQGSNECTDSSGNPVDCNEAFASELAALQNELDQLGQGGALGGGGSGGSGAGGGTGTDGTGATSTAQPPGTPTSSGGATSTGTKTAAKTAGAISGLTAPPNSITKTSFKAQWNAASNATGGYAYIVRDLASHAQVKSGNTHATSVTVSGLKSGTDYNFGIQALPGGSGSNIHVRTK